jgi:hypothetical protein
MCSVVFPLLLLCVCVCVCVIDVARPGGDGSQWWLHAHSVMLCCALLAYNGQP